MRKEEALIQVEAFRTALKKFSVKAQTAQIRLAIIGLATLCCEIPMTLPLEKSAPTDFDFIIGDWTVNHRRLNERLAGCTAWTEFSGYSSTRKILGGFGNLEDNILELPEGPYRAAAMRSYDARSKTWSIWWLDGRNPTQVDTPVVGRFEKNRGIFYADDVFNGRPIKIRFIWSATPNEDPRWEQAFSADGGSSWELNWTMRFVRMK